jgi:hypothetical protein
LTAQPCHRAQCVPGVPREVVAWIDHDRHDGVLFLNGDRYTAAEEAAITDALGRGDYTAAQVMAAFTTTGR